ncbi:MAG: ATP-dependent RecD-like DNA helicase [Chlamydiae bacterium]|nr:ATP-dependent RecD-like DNA helicase [Chlamydiota bacterium]
MEQLVGYVERITFQNPENSFTVAKLKTAKVSKPIAIIGTLTDIQPGESLECQGSWKSDPKHGQQFIVESFRKKAPSTLLGIQKYLSSGLIKGIGPKFAEKIIEKFGLQTLEIISESPRKLLTVEGLGKKKLNQIVSCMEAHKTIQEVMVFLQSHHITPAYAQKIYKRYGHECINIIQQNPYRLAQDIMGIGFKIADKIAESLDIEKNSPARIAAGVEYLLGELASQGHVCYPKIELIEHSCELLEVEAEKVESVITNLNSEKRLMVDFINDKVFVWLKPLHIAELGIVGEVYRLRDHPCFFREVNAKAALDWVQNLIKIKFAKAQKEAITAALTEKMLVITGGPGTGKSTITKAILRILEKLSSRIILAAPTGKAAKRMTEITYRQASTIHGLLEFDFKTRKFRRNHDNPLLADLIIIDEASMIDTYLMFQLLKAIPDSCRVIFIGDIDQLPSVGPGNTLRDLIDSEVITTQMLKFIFRQQKGSKIISSAHSINDGFFPKLTSEPDDDFFFLEATEPQEVLETLVNVVSKRLPLKYNFDPKIDIQVLAPMRKGLIGTESLNFKLQEVLNPNKDYLSWYGKRYAVGDKVMQLKNNYQKEVSNGDVGIISSVSKESQQLQVNFDGKEVVYEFSECDEINLAYAVSVHKYQGSESPCIVMPIHTHHFKLLCRNLLYTGVTRGKKLVILIGTKKALAIAINNNEIEKRYTALKYLLQQKTNLLS